MQRARVRDAVQGDGTPRRPALSLTPAQVEQLTAEYDDIEDMIAVLETKGGNVLAADSTDATPTVPTEVPLSRTSHGGSCDW